MHLLCLNEQSCSRLAYDKNAQFTNDLNSDILGLRRVEAKVAIGFAT